MFVVVIVLVREGLSVSSTQFLIDTSPVHSWLSHSNVKTFMIFFSSTQVETIQQYFPVFDKLRKEFFVGELIWNFADFMTKQGAWGLFYCVITCHKLSASYERENR